MKGILKEGMRESDSTPCVYEMGEKRARNSGREGRRLRGRGDRKEGKNREGGAGKERFN